MSLRGVGGENKSGKWDSGLQPGDKVTCAKLNKTTGKWETLELSSQEKDAVFTALETIHKKAESLNTPVLKGRKIEVTETAILRLEKDSNINILDELGTSKKELLPIIHDAFAQLKTAIKATGEEVQIQVVRAKPPIVKELAQSYKTQVAFHAQINDLSKNLSNKNWVDDQIINNPHFASSPHLTNTPDLKEKVNTLQNLSEKILNALSEAKKLAETNPNLAAKQYAQALEELLPAYIQAIKDVAYYQTQMKDLCKNESPLNLDMSSIKKINEDLRHIQENASPDLKKAIQDVCTLFKKLDESLAQYINPEFRLVLNVMAAKQKEIFGKGQKILNTILTHKKEFLEFCRTKGVPLATAESFVNSFQEGIEGMKPFLQGLSRIRERVNELAKKKEFSEAEKLLDEHFTKYYPSYAAALRLFEPASTIVNSIFIKETDESLMNSIVQSFCNEVNPHSETVGVRGIINELQLTGINIALRLREGMRSSLVKLQDNRPALEDGVKAVEEANLQNSKASEKNRAYRIQKQLESSKGNFEKEINSKSFLDNQDNVGGMLRNCLHDHQIKENELLALANIADSYGEITTELFPHLESALKIDAKDAKSARLNLKNLAEKKIPELNQLTASYKKWGGREKLQRLKYALADYHTGMDIRKKIDEIKNLKPTLPADKQQKMDEIFKRMEELSKESLQKAMELSNQLGNNQAADLLRPMLYSLNSLVIIQDQIEALDTKTTFLNDLFDFVGERVSWKDRTIVSTFSETKEISNDSLWIEVSKNLQLTPKDVSSLSHYFDSITDACEELYLAEKEFQEDPTNTLSQQRLRKALKGLSKAEIQLAEFAKWDRLQPPETLIINGATVQFSSKLHKFQYGVDQYIKELEAKRISENSPIVETKLRQLKTLPNFIETMGDRISLIKQMNQVDKYQLASERGILDVLSSKPHSQDPEWKKALAEDFKQAFSNLSDKDVHNFQGLANEMNKAFTPYYQARDAFDFNFSDSKAKKKFEEASLSLEKQIGRFQSRLNQVGGLQKLNQFNQAMLSFRSKIEERLKSLAQIPRMNADEYNHYLYLNHLLLQLNTIDFSFFIKESK